MGSPTKKALDFKTTYQPIACNLYPSIFSGEEGKSTTVVILCTCTLSESRFKRGNDTSTSIELNYRKQPPESKHLGISVGEVARTVTASTAAAAAAAAMT